MRAVERYHLAAGGLLTIAVLENDFRGALDQKSFLARSGLVERCHEFVFRFEWDGIDPWPHRLLGSSIHAELARKRIKCSLGGITFHFPSSFLLEELGVVAKHRNAAHEREHRVLAGGLPVLLDLALGRIAVAGDLICGL